MSKRKKKKMHAQKTDPVARNQQDQFVEWLTGADVKFPFFQNLPRVPQVKMEDPVDFATKEAEENPEYYS